MSALERSVTGGGMRRLTRSGLLIALCVVGSMIKIPTPLGTPSLDAVPGYLSALAYGGLEGAVVIALGHLITTLYSGAPLGLPIHLVIVLGMAACAAVTSWSFRRYGYGVAMALAWTINSLVLPAIFIVIPRFGWGMYLLSVSALAPAAALNVGVAALVHRMIRRRLV